MRAIIVAAVATVIFANPTVAQPLVDAQWLIDNGADENVVVLDIRADVENTDLGNLPYLANGVVAPYNTAGWRTEIEGVPGKIPPVDDIAGLIGGLGIDNDDHVVIVPWGTNSTEIGSATRVYWTFKYLGHDDVSILDGGWRQYDAVGGERVAEPVTPEAANFEVALQEDLLATTDEVLEALQKGTTLVDGRPREQYLGQTKSPVVASLGTIPSAINIPHSEFYSSEYARFAQPETVEALVAAVGLASNEANISFCNTGHWASVAWFGLSEILGNKQSAMYDGSMSEWTQDPSRPVIVQ